MVQQDVEDGDVQRFQGTAFAGKAPWLRYLTEAICTQSKVPSLFLSALHTA